MPITIGDIKRKGVFSEIIQRLTAAEKDVRELKSTSELTDSIHPLAEFSSITEFLPTSGIEEDIKRKGIMTEIIQRLTKVEADIRKLKSAG